jgi:predicted dienelactone hydrolase
MKRIALALAIIAAAGCSSTPQQKTAPAPQPASYAPSYAFNMGSSPIGVIPSALLRDATRNKDVEVSIEYPTRGTGPFPIIIFSPGYGGSSHAYEALISYWTSYGYVCIRPMHADSGALRDTMNDLLQMKPEDRRPSRRDRTPPNPDKLARTRPNLAEAIWDKEREPQWRDRVRDVTVILDSLNDLEKNYPELAGKMDHARIGVGGHSYGAFTAMLVGGAKAFGNPPVSGGDPRVKAILAMSPQGVASNRGLTTESWRDLRLPAMFMTGTRDYGANETENPDWRRTAYENSPTGDKYFVLIRNAGHLTFTGLASGLGQEQYDRNRDNPIVDPRTGQILNAVPQQNNRDGMITDRGTFGSIRSISLMFWDSYLKDKADAKALLDPTKYAGSVEFSRK